MKIKSFNPVIFFVLLLVCISGILIISCSKKQDGYKISGKITGLGNKKMILFEWNGKMVNIDTLKSENDSFSAFGSVSTPVQRYLKIDDVQDIISVFIENSEIQITGDIADLKNISITGSATDNVYRKFSKIFIDKFKSEKDSLSSVYNKAEQAGNDEMLEGAENGYKLLDRKQKEFIIDFSKEHLNSVAVPFIILEELFSRASLVELRKLYSLLSPEILQSKYSKMIEEKLLNLENVAIGKPAPDIVQKDTSGNPIALSAFRGKWVLIEFWSSKCPPCRKENPYLMKIYRKYKDKGFEILGSSCDNKKEEWTNAIRKDGITWLQMSALDRSADEARKKYCVEYSPYNVLINPAGIIISKELSSKELELKLSEVFSSKGS